MNKKAVVMAALFASTGLISPMVYADLPGLSNGISAANGSPESSLSTGSAAPAPAPATPAATAAPEAAPAPKAIKAARVQNSISNHTLEEVMFKVSRAEINLQQMGNDFNGHGPKAIEYLRKALEELQAAKQSR